MKTRTGDMVKNRFYSSLKKKIINNKGLLNLKRKRFTSKFKKKSKNYNSKIKINRISFQINNDKKDRNKVKKESFSFEDDLNNSYKEDFEIKNHENKVNNFNSTNMLSYDSINCKVNLDKYFNESINGLEINEENNTNELNKNSNQNQLFKEVENKIININEIIENNNNNINKDSYFYLEEKLNKNEIINYVDFNDISFKSKLFCESDEIDNEICSLNHQKYDKDDDNLGKINIFPDFE
jgi:hypothetical protein